MIEYLITPFILKCSSYYIISIFKKPMILQKNENVFIDLQWPNCSV